MRPSQPNKKVSVIFPVTLFLLVLHAATITLMAWGQIAVYPPSLAVLTVLFCVYAFSKERQGLLLSASVLDVTTGAKPVVANGRAAGSGRAQCVLPVLRCALETMGAKYGAVYVLDEPSGYLKKVSACYPDDWAFAMEDQTARQVAMSGVSMIMSGSTGDPRLASAIFVPIQGKGIRGVLSAYTTTEEGKVLTRHDAGLADLSVQYISLVLQQARAVGDSQPSDALT